MGILQEVYEALYQCNKCGFCQATCTTYRNLCDETYATRGRIRLILAVADGALERTPAYEEAINTCLTCHYCAITCPSGIKGDELVLAARRDLYEKRGLPLIKKIPLQRVLPYRGRRNMAFAAFRLFRGLLPGTFKGIDVKGMPVARKSFIDSTFELHRAGDQPAGRVAYFVGCMTDHTLPGVAEAVVRVLLANNIEVVVPKKQECCGLPMYTYGDVETAKGLAKKNMEIFRALDVDYVLTGCGSCGGMLRTNYPEIFKGTAEEKAAQEFSARVMDISEYLWDKLQINGQDLGYLPLTVTYHDSCHLARGMGVTKQPRKILQSIPGIKFVEMREADQCCGAAGLFQGLYPEIATKITTNKINNVKKTGADIVAVECPACLHRIQGGINFHKTGQKAVHLVEILDAAYQKVDSLKLAR